MGQKIIRLVAGAQSRTGHKALPSAPRCFASKSKSREVAHSCQCRENAAVKDRVIGTVSYIFEYTWCGLIVVKGLIRICQPPFGPSIDWKIALVRSCGTRLISTRTRGGWGKCLYTKLLQNSHVAYVVKSF